LIVHMINRAAWQLNRRLITALLLLLVSYPSIAADKVSLATDWRAEAPHGGFYQALADGTYGRYGLDVTIIQGGNQVNYKPLLLAGRIDFLLTANLLTVFDNYKNKAPSVVVAAVFQKDPLALMAHPGQGYENFKALRNAPIAFVSKDTQFSVWYWLKEAHGFRDEAIRNYNFNLTPFLVKPRSIQQGYSVAEPIAIRQQAGFEPVVHLLADHGFSTYGSLIETRPAMVQKNPDMVARFVEASMLGWANYLYGDRKAANTLLMRENPDLTLDEIEASVALMKAQGIVNSGDALRSGIGAMRPERVKDFYNKMVQAGLYQPQDVALDKVIHYDFVNRGVGLSISASQSDQ
jgi:NitT/TauT family transport system substrate-binding protein